MASEKWNHPEVAWKRAARGQHPGKSARGRHSIILRHQFFLTAQNQVLRMLVSKAEQSPTGDIQFFVHGDASRGLANCLFETAYKMQRLPQSQSPANHPIGRPAHNEGNADVLANLMPRSVCSSGFFSASTLPGVDQSDCTTLVKLTGLLRQWPRGRSWRRELATLPQARAVVSRHAPIC